MHGLGHDRNRCVVDREVLHGEGRLRLIRRLVVPLIAATLTSLPAAAQAPSGTVEISQVQIAFLVSGNLGSGRLSYHGRTYAFSIGGLGVGGIGINKLEAVGTVYGLGRLEQFPGLYGAARTGIAVGDAGRGQLWLENANGVRLHLRAKREGLALTLGGDGIVVQMK
jgi:hypothetical protein